MSKNNKACVIGDISKHASPNRTSRLNSADNRRKLLEEDKKINKVHRKEMAMLRDGRASNSEITLRRWERNPEGEGKERYGKNKEKFSKSKGEVKRDGV